MHEPSVATTRRIDLAADALLITSGGFALVTAVLMAPLAFGGSSPLNDTSDPVTAWDWVVLAFTLAGMFTGIALGPLAAWRLHHRPGSWRAFLGGVVAFPTLVFAIGLLAPVLATLLDAVLSPVTDDEYAGPLALLVLASLLYLWLAWHSVKVLFGVAEAGGAWSGLQWLRTVAVLSMMALAGIVTVVVSRGDGEAGEALIFAMVAGFAGAAAVLGADALTRPSR